MFSNTKREKREGGREKEKKKGEESRTKTTKQNIKHNTATLHKYSVFAEFLFFDQRYDAAHQVLYVAWYVNGFYAL